MLVKCETCGLGYNDTNRWTICPHPHLDDPEARTKMDEHDREIRFEAGGPWGAPHEFIDPGAFQPQKDVPVTKGFGGPVLGKCETFVDEDGNLCVKAELNAAGYKLLGLPIDTTAHLSVPELEE